VTNENLRGKIRKLFDMAEMGAGNEAEVALAKARGLMLAHNVSRDDISLFTADIPAPKRKEKWLVMLANKCAEFSGCANLVSLNSFAFAGDEAGVAVSIELFKYLKSEIGRRLKKTGIKERKLKNDFRLGCVFGVSEKMEALGGWRDMREKRKRVIQRHFSGVEVRRGVTALVEGRCFEAGEESGADISVNRQAGGRADVGLIGVAGDI